MKRLAPALRAKVSYRVSEPDQHKKRMVTLKSGGKTSETSETSASATQVIENSQQNSADVSPSATSATPAKTWATSAATTAAQAAADVPPTSTSATPETTSVSQGVENNKAADVSDVSGVSPYLSRTTMRMASSR
jgi:hypothetical protein